MAGLPGALFKVSESANDPLIQNHSGVNSKDAEAGKPLAMDKVFDQGKPDEDYHDPAESVSITQADSTSIDAGNGLMFLC